MHFIPPLFRLNTSSSRPSTRLAESEPPSPYLFGSPLTRVRTRTSSISSLDYTSLPAAAFDCLPAPVPSPFPSYSFGAPLSRIETRNDSFDSYSPSKPLSDSWREISEYIGADLTIFQTLPDLVESCRQFNPKIAQFDCAVFTGEYVTGDIDIKYLEHIEGLRNDAAQKKKNSGSMTTVNGASSSSSSDPVEKNTSNVIRETQPLQDVSGGGEVAGGGDFSNAVGLANEGEQSSMSGSMVMGLANA